MEWTEATTSRHRESSTTSMSACRSAAPSLPPPSYEAAVKIGSLAAAAHAPAQHPSPQPHAVRMAPPRTRVMDHMHARA